jgi:hypothetical protein
MRRLRRRNCSEASSFVPAQPAWRRALSRRPYVLHKPGGGGFRRRPHQCPLPKAATVARSIPHFPTGQIVLLNRRGTDIAPGGICPDQPGKVPFVAKVSQVNGARPA